MVSIAFKFSRTKAHNLVELDDYGLATSIVKVAGVKVYLRRNQNNKAHAVTACIDPCDGMGQFMQYMHALACDITG
jgi:hypothetical protein